MFCFVFFSLPHSRRLTSLDTPADNPGAPECRFLIDLAEAWNPLPSGGEGGGGGGGQQLHTVMQGDKQVGAAAEVAPWWEG